MKWMVNLYAAFAEMFGNPHEARRTDTEAALNRQRLADTHEQSLADIRAATQPSLGKLVSMAAGEVDALDKDARRGME